MKRPTWTEHEFDLVIGRLLQLGVLLAALVVLIGAIAMLVQVGHQPAEFGVFHGAPDMLRSLTGIVRGAAHFDSRAIVQLGLVLLILTPTARVALTLGAFLIQRDRLYVIAAGIVLVLLVYGLFWGKA